MLLSIDTNAAVSIHTNGSSGDLHGKESACNLGDFHLNLGQEDSLGKEMALSYSCLENSMDRGAWWAIVHRVIKSQTRLSD